MSNTQKRKKYLLAKAAKDNREKLALIRLVTWFRVIAIGLKKRNLPYRFPVFREFVGDCPYPDCLHPRQSGAETVSSLGSLRSSSMISFH